MMLAFLLNSDLSLALDSSLPPISCVTVLRRWRRASFAGRR
jgi:hypothetical protein